MSAPIASLRDNFTDNSIAATWAAYPAASGSATRSETSGQARITLPSSTAGTHENAYYSAGAYDLTGDGCFWNIATMVSTSVAAYAFLGLRISGADQIRWLQQSGTLKAQKLVGGVVTDLFSVAWSSTTYKYLRIREASGTIFFDSSTNGTSWTNRATTTVASAFAVTALYVFHGAGCGNVASPGTLQIEDFNVILPALSTNWHWTQVEWPLLYRFRSVTLAADLGQGYIATSNDGSTWTYYSGPLGSASGGYDSLTLQSTQAAAEAMAVNLPIDGRWDLPSIVECRFIRLYSRSTITGSAYTIHEYYPRRIVQSDDIEAESIRAINIAASTISADKITATFTITGKTIQTAADGLRVVLSGDNISTYDALNAQQLLVDGNGILLADSTTTSPNLRLGSRAANTPYGALSGSDGTNLYDTTITSFNGRAFPNNMRVELGVHAHSTSFATVFNLVETAGGAVITLLSIAESTGDITANGGLSLGTAGGGLNIGTATGATSGQIATSGSVGVGVAVSAATRLYVKGQGTTSGTFAIAADDSAGVTNFYVRNDKVGFLNNTAWTYSSDAARKTNIRALGRDIVHLMQLRPVRFDYIDGPANRAGFIAQDVQAVFPELVEMQPDGTLGMRTDELLPIMVHAFKRLLRLLVAKGVISPSDIAGVEQEP